MRESQWIEWTRTRLHPREREALLTALTLEQQAQLLEHDYVWLEEAGVLWKHPDGALRRARFTHGTHFRTKHGEFYIDSGGGVLALSNVRRIRIEEESKTKGDRGPFGKYSGTGIRLEGDEHFIIREDEVLAVLE